jgi:hypothetical protein
LSTDPKRIELHIDSDPRLAAAAGGAVRYLAESVGMTEEVCREFQQATIHACVEAFHQAQMRAHVVELLIYKDRLDVAVDRNSSAAIRLSRSVVPQH